MGTGQLTVTAATAAGAPVWVSVAVAVVGSAVIASIVGGVLTQLREAAAARRERYAAAVALLAARVEFPFRIRRRTSDDPVALTALTDRGHDLQERLADARAWITSESPALGEVYAEALAAIDTEVAPACAAAWDTGPVSTAAGMNLRHFGPRDHHRHISHFQSSTRYRFGWRRVFVPNWFVGHRMRRLAPSTDMQLFEVNRDR
jgi:hypothetical protein